MTGWSCRHDLNGICQKLDGAWCRPGMKGCILAGKVTFEDGAVPSPVWPPGHPRARATAAAQGEDAEEPT